MKNLPNEKDWMLTLKGGAGQPPTEHLLKVERSSLRMTNAFIRPTGFGRHPTILDSTGESLMNDFIIIKSFITISHF